MSELGGVPASLLFLVEGKPSSVRDEFIDDERSIGRDLARDSVRINDVKLKKKKKKDTSYSFP